MFDVRPAVWNRGMMNHTITRHVPSDAAHTKNVRTSYTSLVCQTSGAVYQTTFSAITEYPSCERPKWTQDAISLANAGRHPALGRFSAGCTRFEATRLVEVHDFHTCLHPSPKVAGVTRTLRRTAYTCHRVVRYSAPDSNYSSQCR